MPWKPEDAKHKTKKADTPEKQSLWSRIANQVLKDTGDEARAVREANSAIKRMKHG